MLVAGLSHGNNDRLKTRRVSTDYVGWLTLIVKTRIHVQAQDQDFEKLVSISDVKRGQNLEAEAEARATRPMPISGG